MKIIIINYGMGNIHSVRSALNFLRVESEYSNDRNTIVQADKLILPGVGSYRKAMHNIVSTHLDDAIKDAALIKKVPILGICLGMQIMGKSGTEDGFSEGLALFDGIVEKFSFADPTLKIPHIGFSEVQCPEESILYRSIKNNSDFYFIHSYRMLSAVKKGIGFCEYGEKFIASFESDNIFGTQFHPEKSQTNGLHLLKNFISI